jgi:hypothetical protein
MQHAPNHRGTLLDEHERDRLLRADGFLWRCAASLLDIDLAKEESIERTRRGMHSVLFCYES